MDINKSNKSKAFHITRRTFLQLGLWASGLVSTWGIWRFLSFDLPKEALLPSITLAPPNTYLLRSKTYIPEVKAWLIRDQEGLYAVSSTCTHLGCTINGEEDRFACPCHGSQFDLSGRVLEGPATSPLPHYEVRLSENDLVVIDRRVEVPPINRLMLEG